MGTAWSFRSRRRTAAERNALARVEREIRATDPNGRRKYLRDFREAFQSYRSVVTGAEVAQQLAASNVVLIADYHALPASQRYATKVLETVRARGRKVVLALEMVFSRDQHILDEWMADEIDLDEVRERLRFDFEWGYSWEPFRELLQSARRYADGVFGLDCMPRHDMRRIAARDKHAAAMIAEIRDRFPDAVVVVLFGESHLAPTHLPRWLAERRPGDAVTTVLQNVDALYWQAANERLERVEAARVAPDVLCVFNATPLEKYESYRMCIERWRQEPTASPDLAPTIYNLVDSLLAFLHIDKYSAHNGRQPKFLVDLFPEVYARADLEALRRLLLRKRAGEAAARETVKRIHERGSCYVPRMNAMFVHEFRMAECAGEAAQFVHHACRGLAGSNFGEHAAGSPEDVFYRRVVEEALGYLGSRALCPTRPAVRETDLYALYAQPREAIEERTIYSYREYMQMIDFLVLHRDFETHHGRYWIVPELIKEGLQYTGEKFEFVVEQLGAMLGSDLYEAYLAGRISRRFLRSLFFRDLEGHSSARAAYFVIARRVRAPRKRWLA